MAATTHRSSAHFLAAVGMLLASASAYGQASDEANSQAKNLAMASKIHDQSFSEVPSKAESGAVVELTEEGSTARLQLAFPVSSSVFTFRFEAPIDEKTKVAEGVNLDGFSNAVALGINYTWLRLSKTKFKAKPATKAKVKACTLFFDQLPQSKREAILEAAVKATDFEEKVAIEAKAGKTRIDVVIESRCERDAKGDTNLYHLMESTDLRQVDPNLPWVQAFRDAAIPRMNPLALSLGLKVGTKDFDFVVPAAGSASELSEDSTRREPKSIRASIGWLGLAGGKKDWVFWATFVGSESYSDADPVEICKTIEGTSLQSCSDKPFGSPTEKEQELAILEYKTLFSRVAIAAKAFNDFKTDNYGLEVDTFFLKNKEGALTAGASIGWQDDGGVTGSVFLKKGFSFEPSS